MVQCRVQEHEADHIDDLRHLNEDERVILYKLAHRWRSEHDAAERGLAAVIPLPRVLRVVST